LHPDELESSLEYCLEIAAILLVNVLALDRVTAAFCRKDRNRRRRRFDHPLASARSDTESVRHDLRQAIGRVASVGKSPYDLRRAAAGVEALIARRLEDVAPIEEVQSASSLSELAVMRSQLEAMVKASAVALRAGFGEQARRRVVNNHARAAEAVLRALHPKMGSKRIDTLTAGLIGAANESAVRNLAEDRLLGLDTRLPKVVRSPRRPSGKRGV
jgi:hypothetical protein